MSERYPPDEFDRIERVSGRRGAHRARQPLALSLLPVVLVVAAVAVVVLGVVTLLESPPPRSAATADPGPAATTPAATPGDGGTTAPPGATATPDGGTTGGAAPSTIAPGGAPSGAASAPSGEETAPAGDVDRDAAVRVVNGTRASGLASDAAQLLIDAGWDVSGVGNYNGDSVPTTVFYGERRLRATAEAVADDLGGGVVELDPDFTESITVVLGTDYSGA